MARTQQSWLAVSASSPCFHTECVLAPGPSCDLHYRRQLAVGQLGASGQTGVGWSLGQLPAVIHESLGQLLHLLHSQLLIFKVGRSRHSAPAVAPLGRVPEFASGLSCWSQLLANILGGSRSWFTELSPSPRGRHRWSTRLLPHPGSAQLLQTGMFQMCYRE